MLVVLSLVVLVDVDNQYNQENLNVSSIPVNHLH